MTEEQIAALWKARKKALKMSRGEFPECQCSPYGALMTDWDTVKADMRSIYEAMLPVFEGLKDDAA
jgi:hypothetical protein